MVMDAMNIEGGPNDISGANEQFTGPQNGAQNGRQSTNLEELCSLLRNEIPESRQTLLDTQSNLEKVAEYCSTAYLEADDKRLAFENTKNYTTHSLASVAYQINTLAFNILHMLNLQTNQISEMESQLNYINQKFQFHNEKVARRKIALLTSPKSFLRQPKVLIPANSEKQAKYIRKPIDFTLFDDIGHGVKIAPNTQTLFRSANQASHGRMSGVQTLGSKSSMSSMSHYHHYNTLSGSGPAPTTKPPTPPQTVRSGFGTLGRSSQGSKEYRALVPPVAPPQVPKNYEPNYPIGHPKSNLQASRVQSGLNQNPGGYMSGMSSGYQPGQHQPTSHYHPASSNISQASINSTNNIYHQQQVPPPPPDMSNESLPDPPSPTHMHHQGNHHAGYYEQQQRGMNASPPLPPPPPVMENEPIPTIQETVKNQAIYGVSASRQNVPDWAPSNYIEKVIAVYDYIADKDDELTFQENSVIYVIRKNDDGWFEGVMNGVTGLFPGNYVEPCV